jgi:DNA polymerase type B, organellar and viral
MLYNVINNFNDQIFTKFNMHLSSSLTLTSLAFRLYRKQFMKTKIPIIDGHVYDDLKKSYFGGHVDMYMPRAVYGKKFINMIGMDCILL